MVVRAHSGRRPGESGTREAILAAARRHKIDVSDGDRVAKPAST
jgi:hypothetical protein